MKNIRIVLVLLILNCNFNSDKINICQAQNSFILNCDSLINNYKENSIYSVLPDSISSIYIEKTKGGQFIRYILIADSMFCDQPAGDIIGSLVVYQTGDCKKNNEFIEFASNIIPTISIYNKLKVGSSVNQLINELDPPYKIINDYYLYKDAKSNLVSIFLIKNGKISEFKIGKYKKEILNSIESNFNLLINHFP